MIRFIIFCFCILTLISGMLCEIIPQFECSSDLPKNCVIQQARINPCKEATKDPPQPCKLKRGKSIQLEIDLVPGFTSQNLTAGLYWVNGIIDAPLVNMEKNACKTTTCPTVKDSQQTYTLELNMEKYFPLSTFDVKYLLTPDDEEMGRCCFVFKIRIIK